MADDSDEVINPMIFEVAAPPQGMLNYELETLTPVQQILLNRVKTNTAREDWMYLARHPEVHAVVALLLRGFFRDHPRRVHQYAANFVLRPEFRGEVNDYLIRHPAPPPPPGPITAEISGEVSEEPEEVETVVAYEDEAEDEEFVKWIQDLILSGFTEYIGEGEEKLTESEIFRRKYLEEMGFLSKDALESFGYPHVISSLGAMESLDVIGLQLQPPRVMDDEIIKARLQRISEDVDNDLDNEGLQDVSEDENDDQHINERLQDASENEDDDKLVEERLNDAPENEDDGKLVEERLQDVSENEDDDQLIKERLPEVSENIKDSPSKMQNTP